jgi:hypothetical protein
MLSCSAAVPWSSSPFPRTLLVLHPNLPQSEFHRVDFWTGCRWVCNQDYSKIPFTIEPAARCYPAASPDFQPSLFPWLIFLCRPAHSPPPKFFSLRVITGTLPNPNSDCLLPLHHACVPVGVVSFFLFLFFIFIILRSPATSSIDRIVPANYFLVEQVFVASPSLKLF